jgi:hypothetical protein
LAVIAVAKSEMKMSRTNRISMWLVWPQKYVICN